MTVFTHFLFIPRFLLAWFSVMGAMIICAIASIGHKRSELPGPIRTWIFRNGTRLGARMAMFIYGIVWLKKEQVSVDYAKWLGPEWKFDAETSFKGAGTYVGNH